MDRSDEKNIFSPFFKDLVEPNVQEFFQDSIETGKMFHCYQIQEKLGQGGMGIVYKVLDTKLQRIVALKLILDPQTNAKQRLFREAMATAQLNHPNIVKLFEVGSAPTNYFTMEYIEGCTLASLIKNYKIKTKKIIKILEKVANALHTAHEKNIIHRDIKPSNIMLTNDGEPKIMDFGLAKVANEDNQLSKTGDILGTLVYMPPEQGEGKKIDRRADIYSLGATLYETLTGRPPFQGDSSFNILYQILNDDLVPLRSLNPTIPKDLEAICLKCLQKKPAKRYPNAKLLAKDFNNFLNNKPITAKPISWHSRAGKWILRHKLISLTVFGIVFAIFTFMIVSLQFSYREALSAIHAKNASIQAKFETIEAKKENAKALLRLVQASLITAKRNSNAKKHLHARQVIYEINKTFDKTVKVIATHNKIIKDTKKLLKNTSSKIDYYISFFSWQAPFLSLSQLHQMQKEINRYNVKFSSLQEEISIVAKEISKYKRTLKHFANYQITPYLRKKVFSYYQIFPKGKEKIYHQFPSYRPSWKYSVIYSDLQRETIKVWSIEKKEIVATIKHPKAAVTYVAFSNDSRFLASGDSNGNICLWDEQTNKLRRWKFPSLTKKTHYTGINGLNFSYHNRFLLAATRNTTVLWKLSPFKEIMKLNQYGGTRSYCSSFLPNKLHLAIASETRKNHGTSLWDMSNIKKGPYFSTLHRTKALCFSPGGHKMAYSLKNTIFIYNFEKEISSLKKGEQKYHIQKLKKHNSDIEGIVWNPGGRFIASVGKDNQVIIWDVYSAATVCILPLPTKNSHTKPTLSITFHSHKNILGIWSAKSFISYDFAPLLVRKIKFFALNKENKIILQALLKRMGSVENFSQEHISVKISSQNRFIAYHIGTHTFLWDNLKHKQWLIAKQSLHKIIGNELKKMSFSPDESMLVLEGRNYTSIYNTFSKKKILEYTNKRKRFLGFYPDYNWLVTSSSERKLQFWSIKRNIKNLEMEINSNEIDFPGNAGHGNICFSKSGNILASLTKHVSIFKLDQKNKKYQKRNIANAFRTNFFIKAQCFFEQDRLLAIGTKGGEFLIWDWKKNKIRYQLQLHDAIEKILFDKKTMLFWIVTSKSIFIHNPWDALEKKSKTVYPLTMYANQTRLSIDIANNLNLLAIVKPNFNISLLKLGEKR